MVFVNRHLFSSVCRWMLHGLITLAIISCTQLEKLEVVKSSRPDAASIKFETPDSVLRWHEETHKSYYGLKGAVERVVINPVLTNTGETASDGWSLWFNRQGRLMRKQRLATGSEPEFETIYQYKNDGQTLERIVTYLDKQLWRSSDYIYESGQLARVDYMDHTTNDRFRVKRNRLNTVNGWFEILLPVEKIEMPRYSEFSKSAELVWSNKGDINNGLGEAYFIRTVDAVTSSSVVDQNTEKMAGRGGYRYRYYDNGLLKAVESYNAHNNRLFHVTEYKYDDLWLLVEENKQVKDTSVFNQVIPEQTNYDYQVIDSHGNWLQRTLRSSSKYQQQSYDERRVINYFDESRAQQ
ncbi:hypothetical protein [Kaarinaea lacus]